MTDIPTNVRAEAVPVLVVDDDPDARWLLAALLADAGYAVSEASNADDALQCLAERGEIQAVISDIQMPGTMNGFEFAIRVNRESPEIAVLLISGLGIPAGRALPSGMRFLRKPWAAAEVLELLEGLLSGRRGTA